MRDMEERGTALAARYRNLRRGSFILDLPLASHHSITSSARASRVGGMSMSNPLGVCILMTTQASATTEFDTSLAARRVPRLLRRDVGDPHDLAPLLGF